MNDERKYCPKCKGRGWLLVEDATSYDKAYPCECEEGKKKAEYLLNRRLKTNE